MILERKDGEREKERVRERERLMGCLPVATAGDEIHHPDRCPDLEANPQPLDVWDNAPAN